MSERDNASESGGAHHNIVLSPEEKRVFGQLFQAADSEGLGVVTGELAVKFFEKSGLSPRILGEIWGIADTENRGLLTKVGFSVALRLIGQAQHGQHPRPELAQHPGPLPRFEGVNIQYPPTSSPTVPQLQAQPTGPAGVVRVPPLMPQDVERFTALFEKSGAVDGILSGQLAREIFQRSKLPTQTLIQIWNLADRQHRGALGAAEFVVAMHLITCSKNGTLPVLPQILPPGLYEAAAGRPPRGAGPERRGSGRPPVPPIPKQYSGPNAHRTQSPLARQYTPPQAPPPIQQNLTGGNLGGWAISPAEKARFDSIFDTVGKANPDVITGEEAVPFFSNSKLPEEVLAQIWDLADVNKAGILTRDEFAIAMYLIVQQHSNPGQPLPDTLPPNLVPPSMRQPQQPQRPATAAAAVQQAPVSPFDPPVPTPPVPPKSAADDLFGLDAFTAPKPPQAAPPSASPFGDDVFQPSQTASPAMSPTTTGGLQPGQTTTLFNRPTPTFVPQSSFGQSIMPTSTGNSISSQGGFGQVPKKPEVDDLLGDADPEVSKKLTNDSTELANLSNQIGSLTKRTQELQQKRATAEGDLSSLTAQKQHIEAQLAQLRAAYEKEAAQVRRVEDQLAASRADTARVTAEYQKVEAEYNQLQYKHREVSTQLEADQRENANLKERMSQINAENRQLREEVEKLTSQARRERGLVAINKKQVNQSEQEREKLRSQIDEARSTVASPAPGSPTPSTVSTSTNPFHRKSPPVGEGSYSASPFAPPKHGAMDDVFGPAFTASPPPTAMSHKTTLSGPSAQSVSEGGHGEHSTPPTSPPASSYQDSPQPSEAPSVAPAHQISSAFLPMAPSRADSMTSSVQVNPSVAGTNAFSRPDTPTNWAGSTAGDSVAAKTDDRRESFSVRSDAGSEAPRAFPSLDNRQESRSPFAAVERNMTGGSSRTDDRPKPKETDSFTAAAEGVPGAFPGVASQPIKPTPTGGSTRSRTSNASRSGFGGDPFGSGKEEIPSNASKRDVDDAFGRLGRVGEHHTGGSGSVTATKFDSEFPPIQEFHNDSDSDSEAAGFEDNFAPTSSPQTQAQPAAAAPAPSNPELDNAAAPPPANAQQSPPGYGQATADQEKSNFPAEFNQLLPSRSDPMRHDAATPGGSANAVAFPTPPSNTAPAPAKDAFDDDAFADLAEAKETDDKDEFNTSTGFDDFDLGFDNTTPKNQDGRNAGNVDDFGKFGFNVDQNNAGSRPESPVMQKPATAEDWDAIFAGFGDNANQAKPAPKEEQAGEKNTSGTDAGEGGVSLGGGSEAGKEAGDSTNDEKVSKLTALGFDKEKAMKALEKCGGDLDRAANDLLTA